MTHPREHEFIHPEDKTHESNQSLWLITAGPAIWAAHFLLSYITAAVWCAKFAGRTGPLSSARTAIAIYTVIALAGIAFVSWKGYRRHGHGEGATPHDYDSPADRHRFLGFATLLLSLMSFVATIFVALAAAFIGDCN
jgi:hypothetical protein